MVLDPDDTETDDPDVEPEQAKIFGLKSALGVSETEEVVANAKAQLPSIDTSGLVAAFNYYHANDAFIRF